MATFLQNDIDASQLSFMIETLKEFNYPCIHAMEDIEIMDVFSAKNTPFLVSWILKQLGHTSDFIESGSKEDLAEIVCCYGFCTASNKNDFMNGTCKHSLQFNIFYKMFSLMKSVATSRPTEDIKSLQLEDIDDLIKLDTNLFPKYGPKRTLTPEERKKRLEQYYQETEDIKNYLRALNQTENVRTMNLELKSQLAAAMKNVQLNFPNFKQKAFDALKYDHLEESESVFGDNFAEVLERCNKNVKMLLEYLESVSVVTNWEETTFEFRSDDNKNVAMIRRIADLCQEISTLKKQ